MTLHAASGGSTNLLPHLASGVPEVMLHLRALGLLDVRVRIVRAGHVAFEDGTSTARLIRSLAELCAYLGRCISFPAGVILLTGTGIMPPDAFTLAPGDVVVIGIEGIGELTNTVTTVPA